MLTSFSSEGRSMKEIGLLNATNDCSTIEEKKESIIDERTHDNDTAYFIAAYT
jgi:hypothetical protein